MRLASITGASRITGHHRKTLETWVNNGWLPVIEVNDGRGVRLLIDLDDLPAARETASRRPKLRVIDWLPTEPAPSPTSRQGRALKTWLRRHGRILQQ